jgi:hypothetical protein
MLSELSGEPDGVASVHRNLPDSLLNGPGVTNAMSASRVPSECLHDCSAHGDDEAPA